jgi:hypothetical protein
VATEGSSSQRAWRAVCPNCGAPVEFRSAASASAVCSFCRSTLVRDGDALQRIGISSELFEDYSPLQLGAAGRFQGLAFTLVGRLQIGYAEGSWNEWHALFDNARSGWLSEDNGAFVFAFDSELTDAAPDAAELHAGERRLVAGRAWDVASVTRAHLIAAQGELPQAPRLQGEFIVADLRNAQGEVATLDYSAPSKVQWSVGRSVLLADLALNGLRETGEKSLAARTVECPSCGASLEVKLATTQSITCHQCKAVVDVSAKVGDALAHYQQANSGHDGAEPSLPLGSTGTIALGREGALPWTVVGMVERCDIPGPDDDEQTYWREYLAFNQKAGFVFIVDAEDGWSWVRPITGAPEVRGNQAQWDGVTYQGGASYAAKVTWVQGEFYWRVARDERALVTDYQGSGAATRKRLSREQTGSEVTWSAGEALDPAALGKAFGVTLASAAATPLAMARPSGFRMTPGIVVIVIALLVLLVVMDRCSSDCASARDTFGADSAEYQQCLRGSGSGVGRVGGGSYGGYSSGGGHK